MRLIDIAWSNLAVGLCCVLSAIAPSLSLAQEPLPSFGLKGLNLAGPMAACPDNSTGTQEMGDGSRLCHLPGGTLAGTEVTAFQVQIWDGRIVSLGATLAARRILSGGPVLDALQEKYGRPTNVRSHIGQYLWHRGNDVISLDSMQGRVVVADTAALGILRARAADKNKRDL